MGQYQLVKAKFLDQPNMLSKKLTWEFSTDWPDSITFLFDYFSATLTGTISTFRIKKNSKLKVFILQWGKVTLLGYETKLKFTNMEAAYKPTFSPQITWSLWGKEYIQVKLHTYMTYNCTQSKRSLNKADLTTVKLVMVYWTNLLFSSLHIFSLAQPQRKYSAFPYSRGKWVVSEIL